MTYLQKSPATLLLVEVVAKAHSGSRREYTLGIKIDWSSGGGEDKVQGKSYPNAAQVGGPT